MHLVELARRLGADLRPPAPGPLAHAAYETLEILGVAGIETASPDQLTFVANPRYARLAHSTRAGALLLEPSFPPVATPSLRIENPYLAFARALEIFYPAPAYPAGVHVTAVIDPSAQIGESAHIGPYVVVGPHATIGASSVLLAHVVVYAGARIGTHFFAHAHAVVREGCVIGDHVTLGNGAVIGSDGFGFAKTPDDAEGGWHKIPQTGPAVLEDHVEVQALACVDRASVGETRIGRGARIDNLVQVGHGSSVGAGTLLCAQVGLAGSTRVGRNAILAGQVGVAGHCTLGDGVIATAQSGIPADVEAGAVVSGYPAIPNRQWLRATAAFGRLPETLRKLQRRAKSESV